MTRLFVRLVTAAACVALVGCPGPKLAKIVSFTAQRADADVTLTWETENATKVAIRDSFGKALDGVTQTSGTLTTKLTGSGMFLLLATGENSSDAAVVDVSGMVLYAMPATIASGDSAHLLWSGAVAPTIKDGAGAAVDTGGRLQGSAQVSPTKTTTYTATFGDSTTTATIKVTPAVSLLAYTAKDGSKVTLDWTTSGADSLKITSGSRTVVTATAQNLAAGTFDDTLPGEFVAGMVVPYVAAATNAEGTNTVRVLYTVGDGPGIAKWDVPAAVTKGKGPKVAWEVTNASAAFIEQDGIEIYRASAAAGSVTLPPLTADAKYTLVVTSGFGNVMRSTKTTKVVDPPAIATFTASPSTVAAGGGEVTFAWSATSAVQAWIAEVGVGAVFATKDPAAAAGAGGAKAYPAQTTSYELTVANLAGDTTQKSVSVTVTTPLAFSISPGAALPGETLTLDWNIPGATAVTGVPLTAVTVVSSAFSGIEASSTKTEVVFASSDNAVAVVDLPAGFAFPFLGGTYTKIVVSTNGWLSLDTSVTSSYAYNSPIGTTSSPNALVAPFWDDLSLGDGKVYYDLVGTAPNRKFVVQWNNVSTVPATTDDVMTFTATLHENGSIAFAYKTAPTSNFAAVIGIENQNGSVGFEPTFPATDPAANELATFFAGAPGTGTATILAAMTGNWIIFGDVGGKRVALRAPSAVLRSGDLAFSELMYKPATTVTKGQWVEVRNRLKVPVDLKDFVFAVGTTTETIASSLPVPPEGVAVLGQTTNQAENGGAKVDYAYAATVLLPATTGTMTIGKSTTTIATVTYNDATLTAPEGTAVIRDVGARTASPRTPFCLATQTFGTASQKGTPGAPDLGCYYGMQASTTAYRDIAGTGTKLTFSDTDEAIAKFTFPAGFTFKYFGKDYTSAVVGTNGFVSFVTTTCASSSNCYYTSADTATVAAPNGYVAPFWDDMMFAPGGAAYYQLIDPDNNPSTKNGFLVIEWARHSPWYSVLYGEEPGDVNFQVLLYENGDVEFVYGKIVEGDMGSYAYGYYATVGIEDDAGTWGYTWSYRKAALKPNTAILFKKL